MLMWLANLGYAASEVGAEGGGVVFQIPVVRRRRR